MVLNQIMNYFSKPRVIYCDNEPSLNSHTISTQLNNHFGVSIANAPLLHSVSNGQVERFHCTLSELSRCLKIDSGITTVLRRRNGPISCNKIQQVNSLSNWQAANMMPFGLHSAPATFQRALDTVIGPDMESHAFAYLDDIIVTGSTLKEPVRNLRESGDSGKRD